MRIRPILFGLVVVVVFLAPVVVAQATGTWATIGRPAAGAGQGGGAESGEGQGGGGGSEGQGAGGGQGQGAGGGGSVAPGDARGWMTLAQVAEANDTPLEEIIARFGLPPDTDPATELRDLESETFSVSVLRDWLAERSTP